MKKVFLFAAVCAVVCGCGSSDKKQNYTSVDLAQQYTKYQIVDQEFDNLVVPNDNYDRVTPYEEQVSNASFIQSNTRKSGKKPARNMQAKKVVVDGEGHQLPADVSAPVTDQEALPDEQ